MVAPSQVNAPLVPEPMSTSAVPEDSQEEQVKGDQEMTEMKSPTPVEETSDTPSSAETSAPSSYGPIRRRIEGKDGPMALWRPPALKQTDFVDIMKEIVPQHPNLLKMHVCRKTKDRHLRPPMNQCRRGLAWQKC